MSNMENDPTTGLMPVILALVSPPGMRDFYDGSSNTYNGPSNTLHNTASPEKIGLAAHPYFRRPGKGHNRDSCDACLEGGDLICCDICPASFHLSCHDPPLDEDNIPKGEWTCQTCRINKEEKKCNGGKKVEKKNLLNSGASLSDKEIVAENVLLSQIKSTTSCNPQQFNIPYRFQIVANFPNEPKEIKKSGSRRKKPYELDHGIVPKPIKLCFQCSKSCREGPMVPCDYCELLFHLDCLNPPLTIPPPGKWMCPIHPEHFADINLTSHSLLERVNKWEEMSKPISEYNVKMNFIRHCNQERSRKRYIPKKETRSRVRVPRSVKIQYNQPSELLPPLVSSATQSPLPPHLQKVQANEDEEVLLHNINTLIEAAQVVEENNKNSVVHDLMNREILHHKMDSAPVNNGYDFQQSSLLHNSSVLDSKDSDRDLVLKLEKQKSDLFNNFNNSTDGISDDNHRQFLIDLVDINTNLVRRSLKAKLAQEPIENGGLLGEKTTMVNGNLSKIKQNVINTVGFQPKPKRRRLNKSYNMVGGRKEADHLVECLYDLKDTLKNKILYDHDKEMTGLSQTLMEVLAYERLQALLNSRKEEEVKQEKMEAIPIRSRKVRALLCPIAEHFALTHMAPNSDYNYSEEPTTMNSKIFEIGTGGGVDVDLRKYGHCNFISSSHASIWYDEDSGVYEFMNNSPFGSIVDGVPMEHEIIERPAWKDNNVVSFSEQVDALIKSKGKPVDTKEEEFDYAPTWLMRTEDAGTITRCECRRNKKPSSEAPAKTMEDLANEGCCILNHGSFIQFGCLKFVFSIVAAVRTGDWATDVENTYKKFLEKEKSEVPAQQLESTS